MQVPIYIYSLILHQTRNFTRKNRPCVRIRCVPNLEEELCFVESPFFTFFLFFFFFLLFSSNYLLRRHDRRPCVRMCIYTSVCIRGNRKWTTAKTTISVACWHAMITINCTLHLRCATKV